MQTEQKIGWVIFLIKQPSKVGRYVVFPVIDIVGKAEMYELFK